MKIDTEVMNSLVNLNFLSSPRSTDIPIVLIKNLKEAEKNITSLKWENYCLDKNGDLTAYLFKNEKTIYNEWNNLVKDSKKYLIPKIEEKLYGLVNSGYISENMISQIKFDIIGLSVYLTIKAICPTVDLTFYNDIYALYQSGFIPCGHSKGKYKVW